MYRKLRIDTHTHILPKTWPNYKEKFGSNGFVELQYPKDIEQDSVNMFLNQTFFRQVHSNCFNTKSRLNDLRQDQITMQVLCTVPVMFHYWAKPQHTLEISQYLNDDIANTIQQYPSKYLGLGTIPMNSTSLAIQELERCMTTLGFCGIQIGSHINEKTLADPSLFPIFEAAQEWNAAILIHPWDMVGKELMDKYWLPWLVGMPAECSFAACSLIFGGILEKLPNLRICLSHGGGSFPWTIGRIEHGYNVRPDLVAVDNPVNPREYLKRFYYDGHVCDAKALINLIDLVGEERMMLGSDYPFPLGETPPGSLMDSIRHGNSEQFDYKTALSWLGITMDQIHRKLS